MAEIRIGELEAGVDVTDTDALLHPAVMARIVDAVRAQLAREAREDALREAETRITADAEQTP